MTIASISTANAKEEFADLINRVAQHKERIILTRRGKEVAVIIPMEDLILLENSEAKSDLQQAIDALNEARTKGTFSLEKLKKDLGETS